tara:strand:+ start:83 stop:1039 length:957 start_codon:yes stop_codon:yes gene_type:complete
MNILNQISKKNAKILVIGDLMLDRYIFGETTRISPEAPVPIVKFSNEKFMLGGCGNVVRNLHNLGIQTSIISVTGDDPTGQKIIDELNVRNIPTSGIIRVPTICTTEKMRILSDKQQIVRVDWDANQFEQKYLNKLFDSLAEKIERNEGVIISDYGKGFCKTEILDRIIETANLLKVPVFIDPKGQNWEKYCNVNLITPNTKEAESLINKKLLNDKDFENAGKKICDRYKIKSCLITRGQDGMSYISSDQIFHLRSKAKEIFDVSGAGDTVIASIVAAIISGSKPREAAKFANNAAGIVVGHIGTSAITVAELEKIYN